LLGSDKAQVRFGGLYALERLAQNNPTQRQTIVNVLGLGGERLGGWTQPTCYEFKGPGDGQGECMKNNARSAWHRMARNVLVYYNSNYGGDADVFGAGEYGDFSDGIADNNASHEVR
jgi:hypothetical protein